MSWDPYLKYLEKAAYYGIYSKVGAVCGQSSDTKVSFEEIIKIVSCIDKKESTFEVSSQPCVLLITDDDYVQGKTKAACHSDNKIFYHCEVTKTLLIIVGMVGAAERDAAALAQACANKLKEIGY